MADPELARLAVEFEDDQMASGPRAKPNLEGLHHEQQSECNLPFVTMSSLSQL